MVAAWAPQLSSTRPHRPPAPWFHEGQPRPLGVRVPSRAGQERPEQGTILLQPRRSRIENSGKEPRMESLKRSIRGKRSVRRRLESKGRRNGPRTKRLIRLMVQRKEESPLDSDRSIPKGAGWKPTAPLLPTPPATSPRRAPPWVLAMKDRISRLIVEAIIAPRWDARTVDRLKPSPVGWAEESRTFGPDPTPQNLSADPRQRIAHQHVDDARAAVGGDGEDGARRLRRAPRR